MLDTLIHRGLDADRRFELVHVRNIVVEKCVKIDVSFRETFLSNEIPLQINILH